MGVLHERCTGGPPGVCGLAARLCRLGSPAPLRHEFLFLHLGVFGGGSFFFPKPRSPFFFSKPRSPFFFPKPRSPALWVMGLHSGFMTVCVLTG